MTLEFKSSNFTKWSQYFRRCGKFSLLGHLDGPISAVDAIDSAWAQGDDCVRS